MGNFISLIVEDIYFAHPTRYTGDRIFLFSNTLKLNGFRADIPDIGESIE
jgi:hypothetical protein